MKTPGRVLEQMLESIIGKRPKLSGLKTDSSLQEYLNPALTWSQQKENFPYIDLLAQIITAHIKRLYGQEQALEVNKQLTEAWVVETGAHLYIPRRYNKAAETKGAQINSLLFQGQILWALANQALGRKFSVSLNSGRVPLDNTNSGVYLDLPALKAPMPLASKKRYPEEPQSFIPAASQEDIKRKMELLQAYKQQNILPEDQFLLGMEVLQNFLKIQSSFSDQVTTTHAFLLNRVLSIKQITLDSELIGRDFIIALLKDKKSLTYRIFDNPKLRQEFFDCLSDVRTGWPKGGSAFHSVVSGSMDLQLFDYQGNDLDPETIMKGLEERTIWPTGVMKFFAFMVEGGILPTGGWTQAGYCTDLKTKAVKFLKHLGEGQRAQALEKMPTDIAAVAPCWGIDQVNGNFQLLDAMITILDPQSVDFSGILKLTGNKAFLAAAPTLYEFILGEQPPLNYNGLKDELGFAMVHNSNLFI